MTKNFFLLAVSFLVLYGCKEEESEIVITVPPIVAGKTGIYGKWFWIKSVSVAYGVSTPQSTGRTSVYVFNTDSTFQSQIDGVTKINTTYAIKKETTVFGTQQDVIRFADNSSRQYVVLAAIKDTLFFADNHTDGFSYTYIRIE